MLWVTATTQPASSTTEKCVVSPFSDQRRAASGRDVFVVREACTVHGLKQLQLPGRPLLLSRLQRHLLEHLHQLQEDPKGLDGDGGLGDPRR